MYHHSQHVAPEQSLEIEIPKRSHSVVIGKGGQTVQQLQQSTGARIVVPKQSDPSSKILIEGSKQAVQAAIQELERLLNLKLSDGGVQSQYFECPKAKHSIIIGKGGSSIRELQSKHSVQIQVPMNSEPSSVIGIQGSMSCIADARQSIERLIGQLLSPTTEKPPEVCRPSSQPTSLSDKFAKLDLDVPRISEALFFPDDGPCYERFLQYLLSVRSTLDVCVFTITDSRVASALIELQKKGVRVRVITDDEKSSDEGSDIAELKQSGVAVRMDNSPSFMHNKFAILDKKVLLNGSFNWTRAAALENRENIVIINDSNLVQLFGVEFEKLWNLYK